MCFTLILYTKIQISSIATLPKLFGRLSMIRLRNCRIMSKNINTRRSDLPSADRIAFLFFGEVVHRVDSFVVDTHLKMKMSSVCNSGGAHSADILSLIQLVADIYINGVEMSVES